MILADTSVWIDHLRDGNPTLDSLLDRSRIICHPVVIGELACGTFPDREEILRTLKRLPQIMEAQHEEVLTLIEAHRLMGSGIGWSDAHLLTSALLDDSAIWTFDKRLAGLAKRLGVQVV